MGGQAYHLHAIISKIEQDWSSQRVVEWYNDRCGGGEAIHSILKSDLAAGRLRVEQIWGERGVVGCGYPGWSRVHATLEKLAMPAGLSGKSVQAIEVSE